MNRSTGRVRSLQSTPSRPWRRWTILGLLLIYLALRVSRFAGLTPPADLPEGDYQVARVVDGDTLVLTGGQRVRLIGVDCPESVKPGMTPEPFGNESSTFTRELVEKNRGRVTLQFDRERLDRYDRYLAFVWVDGRLLNEELLRAGLARWESEFNYSSSMKTRFRKAETEARDAKRGIWRSAE